MSSIAETLDSRLPARAASGLRATLRPVSHEEWEATVGTFDGVSQEQLYTFAHARWPHVTLEPVVFSAAGEVIGGCLVMLQRLPLGLATIAIAKWGPFLKSSHGDAIGRYAAMVDALIAEYAQKRRMMLSLLPLPTLGETNEEFDLLIGRGFRRGSQMAWNDRYIVRLGQSDDEQRKSFGQTWRRQLGKAEKAGLSFERASPDRLPEFEALYDRMVDRKGFEDRSAYRETIAALMAMQSDLLRPELFFVSEGGEVIAGAIIFKAGERAVYLYGATQDRALPLRAGYFLHWHIIGWLRDNTVARWYDLGGTDGFQGLHQFKKGMVGDAGRITPVPPTANYAAYPLPLFVGEAAFRARELIGRLKAKLRERRRSGEDAEQ
jgi:lipid II:glycine glycyltransferase (peptidoglycan interpeptide bridge formation enzyme)